MIYITPALLRKFGWRLRALAHEICVSYVNTIIFVVPAWTAGTQADMDVSGRILRA